MKFAHKLTLALLVVLAVVLSLCNTVLIGQQFRQELHTAQETLSADWQRESRAMQRTLVTPGSGSLAARVGSYLQAITEQNSLACAAYSVDGTSLYYALPTPDVRSVDKKDTRLKRRHKTQKIEKNLRCANCSP